MLNAAARSTGLIALAVGIGVVLLQLSDDSTEPLAAGGEAVEVDAPRRTTTTSAPGSTTTTTAPDEAAEDGSVSAKDVTVLVLNASGRDNQARPLSERLRVVGYETLEPGNAPRRDASVVLCRPGHADDASALVAATGLTAEVDELDDAGEFPESEAADCIVVIGAR